MSTAENKIIVTPSPERLICSLTSLGHSFATAVADLVDNSIEAEATKISIYVHFNGAESVVCISDNGRGMTPEIMKEAMRFGTRRDYGLSDLGKFGLGLKTASLSQCRKFTVASRLSHSATGICAMSWDMTHLEKSKAWEVLQIQESALDANILDPLRENTGTVVCWSQINNLFEYKNPSGGWAKNRLVSMCRELEDYLAMVFHRFLDGEGECRTVNITLNGNDIESWDPFARNEQYTKTYPPTTIEVEEGSITGKITMSPFVLPHKEHFSSPQAFKNSSGPANWNQQQGFYIYRAERMIQSGGWCNTRTADEHTKLARIALHFCPELDDAFNIDVTKMNVSLPASLGNQIREHIKPVIKAAQEAYRHPQNKSGTNDASSQKKKSNGETRPMLRPAHKWTFDEITKLLRGAALPGELPVLEKIIRRVSRNIGRQ